MISAKTKKEFLLMVVDQSTWRSSEWGDDLLKGQFNAVGVEVTPKNVSVLKEYTHSDKGLKDLIAVINSNESYYDDGADLTPTDIANNFLDSDFGILGSSSFDELLKKSWRK